jgi:uncharacterized membrane protein (DUF106 family)
MKAFISENTYASLGVVAIIVAITVWAVSLEAKVLNHADLDDKRVDKMQQELRETQKLFYSIDKRLARIEEKLHIKE